MACPCSALQPLLGKEACSLVHDNDYRGMIRAYGSGHVVLVARATNGLPLVGYTEVV